MTVFRNVTLDRLNVDILCHHVLFISSSNKITENRAKNVPDHRAVNFDFVPARANSGLPLATGQAPISNSIVK